MTDWEEEVEVMEVALGFLKKRIDGDLDSLDQTLKRKNEDLRRELAEQRSKVEQDITKVLEEYKKFDGDGDLGGFISETEKLVKDGEALLAGAAPSALSETEVAAVRQQIESASRQLVAAHTSALQGLKDLRDSHVQTMQANVQNLLNGVDEAVSYYSNEASSLSG